MSDDRQKFQEHLDAATRIVSRWPAWKRNALGGCIVSDDLKAAIERLRRIEAGEEQSVVYHDYAFYDEQCNARENDEAKVIAAYLHEHLAEDAAEVTQDTVASWGWAAASLKMKDWPIWLSPSSTRSGPVCAIRWEPLNGCDGWAIINREDFSRWADTLIPPPESVGQLRRLCAALGIKLEEQG